MMKNGIGTTMVGQVSDTEAFGNRKLIRPSLNREALSRTAESVDRRERAERPDRSDRSNGTNGSFSKKTPPPEQTHAENFYYQKQMQSKTPMVVVTTDGEQLKGIIEWYDKSCIKLNRNVGEGNLLIYKSCIKYMFKEGELTGKK